MNKLKKGFTLIELLMVIGIITILAGIILVSVNPAQQFGKANDAERKTSISSILNAVMQYTTTPTARGELPECLFGIAAIPTAIPECDTDGSGSGVGNGGFEGAVELGTPADDNTYDCSTALVPNFLREMPIDPNSNYDETATGYYICMDTSDISPKIYVISMGAEVFLDGNCEKPNTTVETMCISG
ncbi:type II secretion system protein [Candidatus Peregrinibacteria bacterium]|nr:type II secretion system protein [Candidatus Peregrinibacteria bacterium]